MTGRSSDCSTLYLALDLLCPMHLLVDQTGHIAQAGSTLRKLNRDGEPLGQRLLEFLELRRPRIGQGMDNLRALAGVKLHIALRAPPRTELKGVLFPIPADASWGPPGGALLNLSFGISVVDAVRDFALTSADFAATDLAVEMLYLVEAKSAAMEASRKLNLRLQGARIAAEEQAFTDTLTGLKNRRAFEPVLNRLIEGESDFALMHLDLDHFKAVNDTMGHAAGDYVLQEVARILVTECRRDDAVIRVGGDEFVLVFPGLTDPARIPEVTARLIRRLEVPIPFNGETCRISASIGATLSRGYNRPDIDQMMQDADIALYAAKDRGRGCHVIYSPALGSSMAPTDRRRA